MAKRIIFLVGLPRSGTTWIGKIFDSHPDTIYRHEPDSVYRLAGLSMFPESQDEEGTVQLKTYAAGLSRLNSPRVVGKLPLFRKNYQNILGYNILKLNIFHIFKW